MAEGAVTCPLPTAHTYADVKAAYDKAKKAMPGLTPAAWRKAAAQSLGMDYNSYLAIFKTKGKTALVAASTPTVPAVATQVAVKAVKPPTKNGLNLLLQKNGFKKQAYTKVQYTHTGQVYGGGSKLIEGFKMTDNVHDITITWVGEVGKKLDDMMDFLKAKGYKVEKYGNSLIVDKSATEVLKTAAKKAAVKTEVKETVVEVIDDTKSAYKPSNAVEQAYAKELDEAIQAIKAGDLDWSDMDDIIGDMALEHANNALIFNKLKAFGKKYVDEAKARASKIAAEAKLPPKIEGVVYTKQGWPLNNDLVKVAYKKMKAEMPGATPAVIRKAAADYLGVDYNDFLKAWKAGKGQAVKSVPKVVEDLPKVAEPPVYEAPVGKYTGKVPTHEQMKDELAALYGPNANKGYMDVIITSNNEWYTTIPNSLVPTAAGKQAVADALKKMGFNVKLEGNKLWAWTDEAKKLAEEIKKSAGNRAEAIAKTGVKTLPDGTKVLDMDTAQKHTDDWWRSLSESERQAWKNYTGSGYSEINRGLRNGGAPTPTAVKLSRSMEKTTREFTVFRGSPIPIEQFRVGKLWTDKGFMSTAVNPGGAWTGTKFEIIVSKGTKGRYIGKKSTHPGENEFLLDRGTKFRVLSITGNTVKLITIP